MKKNIIRKNIFFILVFREAANKVRFVDTQSPLRGGGARGCPLRKKRTNVKYKIFYFRF